jgi:hypothetical protein
MADTTSLRMTSHDAYILLGLSPGCSADDITKAYRKKALIYHPDRKGGDTKKFQAITAAKELLLKYNSPSKSQQYTRTTATYTHGGKTYTADDLLKEFLKYTRTRDATDLKARKEKRERENKEFLEKAKVVLVRGVIFILFFLKIVIFTLLHINGGIQTIISIIVFALLMKFTPQMISLFKKSKQNFKNFKKAVMETVNSISRRIPFGPFKN